MLLIKAEMGKDALTLGAEVQTAVFDETGVERGELRSQARESVSLGTFKLLFQNGQAVFVVDKLGKGEVHRFENGNAAAAEPLAQFTVGERVLFEKAHLHGFRNEHLSLGRLDPAGYHTEKRGFAGAVYADDAEAVARAQRKGDVLEYDRHADFIGERAYA